MTSGSEADSALNPQFQTTTLGGQAMGDASMSNGSDHFIVQTVRTPHTPGQVLNARAQTPADGWVSNVKPGGEGDTGTQWVETEHDLLTC